MIGTQPESAVNSRVFRMLAWLGVALQVAALVFVIASERWGGVPGIAILLALSVGFLLMEENVPSLMSFLVVLAAILNAGGWAWEWFALTWFDEFVHFFTSLAVVSAIMSLPQTRNWLQLSTGVGRNVLWAAAIGLGIGVLWEIGEAIFLTLGWIDTVSDLVLDVLGAAAGGWLTASTVRYIEPRELEI